MANDKVKGTCLRSVLAFLDEEGIRAAAISRLNEASKDTFITTPLATSWYPTGDYMLLLEAIKDVLSPAIGDTFYRIGRRITHDGLSTVYKVFLQVQSPLDGIRRGHALLWRSYFKGSELRLVSSQKGHVVLEVIGEGHTSKWFCETKMGGMLEAISMAGGRDARATHPSCLERGDEKCVFQLTWVD